MSTPTYGVQPAVKTNTPSAPKPPNSLKRIFLFMLWAYIATLAALVVLEPRMLFPAPPLKHGDWDPAKFGASEVWAEGHDDSRIHIWTFKHEQPRATLVFSHGNGEDLGSLGQELLEISRKLSVNVVAYDFRGYGKTGGKPNQANILADAVTVGMWIRDQPDWNQVPVLPIGRSLGGAAAIEMATELQAPGIILDRTFSSAVDVAASIYPVFPVRLLMKNHFPSEEKIKLFSGRVLQFHGDVDNVIPIQFAKKLYDACPSAHKQFVEVPGLGHNDPHTESFWEKTSAFIEGLNGVQ